MSSTGVMDWQCPGMLEGRQDAEVPKDIDSTRIN